MSSKKILSEISNFEIQKASIQSLADRPNNVSRYGDGGLTAEELKKRFDAFPRLAQEKINELIRVLSSEEASKYIGINNIAGKDNLFDFLALFDDATKESIAKYIQVLYTEESAAEAKSKPLDEVIADMQARIASNAATTNFNKERLETICPIVISHSSRLDNHEERLQGIETYLGGDNFILDDTVAYQKVIPANAVGKAKILKIGGMIYKDGNVLKQAKVSELKSEGANKFDDSKISYVVQSGGEQSEAFGTVDNGVLIAKKGYYGNILSWHPFKAYLKKGTYTVSADVYIPTGGAPTLSLTLGVVSGTSSNSLTYIKKTEINSYDAWQRASVSIEVGADGTYLLSAQGNGDASMYRDMDVRFKNISVRSDSSTDYTPYIKHSLVIPSKAQVSNGINEGCYDYLDLARKTVTKNVGVVDLGSLNWAISNNIFVSDAIADMQLGIPSIIPNAICSKYNIAPTNDTSTDKTLTISAGQKVWIVDSAYTDVAAFKAAMAGVVLCYELAVSKTIDVSADLPDPYIEVEGSGTVTAVNEYGYAAPSEIKYLVTYPKEV